MKFDGFLQRAKDRGLKLMVVQLNPKAKLYTTFGDNELSKAVGIAIAVAARQFAENSKGKFTEEQVLEQLFLDVKLHAKTELPRLREPVSEEDRLRAHADRLTSKFMSDDVLDKMFGDDGDDEK